MRRLCILLCLAPSAWAVAAQSPAAKPAKPPRVHSVTLGPARRVPFVSADVASESRTEQTSTLRVRAMYVDGRQREWTVGDSHDVTDRSFVVQRVLRVNDALPEERGVRWVWQPGAWLMVDRVTGRVSALRLPDFAPEISQASWYRDYAAYCGVRSSGKNSGLAMVVWQIGARRAAVEKTVSKWPQEQLVRPVCQAPRWQRGPMRVTMQPTGSAPVSLDVFGTSGALVEEGGGDEN